MITHNAILGRLLPGLSRPAPAATTVGYGMPHERFFFYGASVSALLHVAVLFGFPKPTVVSPTPPVVLPTPPGAIWELKLEEEPPPPPPPTATKPDQKDPAAAGETGESYAHIPTPMMPVEAGVFTIPGKLELGKLPDPNSTRWAPPDRPGTGAGAKVHTGLVDLGDLDKVPAATTRAAPRYPPEARKNGYTGTVLLRFVVDSHGEVSDVEIVRSDHDEFNRAATEAMLRWRFRPGMKNGRRVATRMEMPMVFSLSTGA